MLCFRTVPVAKIVMDKKGASRISNDNFFVSECQNVSGGNPSVLCLRKIPVAKKFM